MYKICIILGWPAIKMQLMSLYQVDYPEVWAKIQQHRIITSEKLDEYYSQKAEKEGLLQEYQEFMHEMLGSDLYTEITDTNNNLSQSLSQYLKKKNKTLAIAIGIQDDISLSKSTCRYQYSIEEAAMDENGPFAMYSVQADFFRKQDESACDCLEWIQNQIKNEKEVNIIDQYIFKDSRNYNSFIKNILPLIPTNCKVNIHTSKNEVYAKQILSDAKQWNIELYYYNEMHNRYITTSDRILGVPIGLDFMQKRNGKLVIRKNTNFTLKRKEKGRAYLEIEKDLAGVPVG